MNGSKSAKFVNVFLLESFPVYDIISCVKTSLVSVVKLLRSTTVTLLQTLRTRRFSSCGAIPTHGKSTPQSVEDGVA